MAILIKKYFPGLITCSIIMLSIALGMSAMAPAVAQTDNRRTKIEAAFLYNFFNYITWPENTSIKEGASVTICVYNNPELVQALRYIEIQKASERQLRIFTLDSSTIPKECQLLFVSENAPVELDKLAERPGLLLVGDISGFARHGGMIELVEEKERITININNTALTKAGFQVSSKLLSIAKEVK
jgi:hypothetical protein